jgi:hypothetical protein
MKATVLLIASTLFVAGCLANIPSISDYTTNKIGRPIEKQRERVQHPRSYASRIGWKEETYSLANGNWVYIEPDSPGCFIHWEVNPKGIIVAYQLEGNCR